MRISAIVLAIVLAGRPVGAGARPQDPAAAGPPVPVPLSAAERRDAVNAALVRLADPTLRAVVSGPVPAILLEAGSAGRAATGRVGVQAGDVVLDVTVRGVINPETGRAVLADLDGLRHTSTAEFGLLWTNYPASVRQPAHQAARQRCVAERAALAAPAPCTPADVARHLDARRLFVAGLTYRLGPEDFSYVAAPGGDPVTVSRVHWSVGGRAGVAMTDRTAFGAIYAHTVSYRSGDTRHICEPIGDGRLECGDQVIGAPARARVRTLTIEARHSLSAGLALSPRVIVGLGSRSVAIEWPMYFLRGAKGGLSGGLTVGWRHSRTAGTGFQITLFAGQSFGVLLR